MHSALITFLGGIALRARQYSRANSAASGIARTDTGKFASIYSPICLMILRGSMPLRIALLASLVIWSSAWFSKASAMTAAFLTISSASSGGTAMGSGWGR